MSYIIGITMRITENNSYYEIRDSISHDYIRYFNRYNNMVSVVIPNLLDDPVDFFKKLGCNGLIITGGEDIQNESGIINKEIFELKNERDRTEFVLLNYCYNNNIPVLGICRGFQLINMYLGGKLIRNLNSCENGLYNHVNKFHRIKIIDKQFQNDENDNIIVNSFHKHGFLNISLGKELKCFALSEDGVIEGIYKEKQLLGIQWHPERNISSIDSYLMNKWFSWIGEDLK